MKSNEKPRFMHIEGRGRAGSLARSMKKTLDVQKEVK